MRTLIKVSLAILVMVTLAWASEPWKDKPYQQWDQKDIGQILTESPWARTISVAADWQPTNMEQNQRGLPNVQQQGDQSGLSRDPQGPQGGRDMGMSPMPNQREASYTARWISSQTMREALARQAELQGRMKEADVERYLAQKPDDYQVVIFGPDMTPFQGMNEADLVKGFEAEGKKSKVQLGAAQAHIDRAPDGKGVVAVVFSFAKQANGKPAFGLDEREIDVVCKLKRTVLKFHFDPKKMENKEGLDL